MRAPGWQEEMGWIYCLLCLLTDSPGTELIAPALSVIAGGRGSQPTHSRSQANTQRDESSWIQAMRNVRLKRPEFMWAECCSDRGCPERFWWEFIKEEEEWDKEGCSSFRFLLLCKHTCMPATVDGFWWDHLEALAWPCPTTPLFDRQEREGRAVNVSPLLVRATLKHNCCCKLKL